MNCNTCVHCNKLPWAKNQSCMYYWEHYSLIAEELQPEPLPKSFYNSVKYFFPYDYNPAFLFGDCKHQYTPK